MVMQSRFLFYCFYLLLVCATVPSVWPAGVYAQAVNHDEQIGELKSKIEIARKKTRDMRESMMEDERSFRAADSIHQTTLHRLLKDKDTLAQQSLHATRQADSVLLEIEDVRRRYAELKAKQSHFGDCMDKACREALTVLKTLPPANLENHLSALEFLQSEIAGKSVENPEALERFWQILHAVDDMARSIDVYTAPSPVAAIQGDVFFIRLGLAWLGIVDQKGGKAFVWQKDSAGQAGEWHAVADPVEAASMLKGAKIRQGNAVPEIVSLPIKTALDREGDKESEVGQ